MPHYYLNIKYITQIMEERGITVKQLVDGSSISVRRINNYLQGRLSKRVPYEIWFLIYSKLNLDFKNLITTEPPEPLK